MTHESGGPVVDSPSSKGPGSLFWVLTLLLTAYVALCTTHRDSIREADAWEHHRALVALTQDLRNPGNPTLAGDAADLPSIRYSPYFVSIAALSRATGLDPWDALSASAVLNALLMCLGVWAVLAALGRAPASGLALLVMVSLYGVAPGYANSYALADLPWHQVNPSAFSFALVLFAWAWFLRLDRAPAPAWKWLPLPLMAAVSLLDHPMTGCLGLLGLAAFSVPGIKSIKGDALRVGVRIGAIAGIALALCLLWPWYGFARALATRPENAYWFNPAIARRILTEWAAPALLLSFWCLTARDRGVVRLLLLGGAASVAVGVVGMAIKSPTLARLPLPGLIFFHLALAVTAHESGLLRRQAWVERWRALKSGGPGAAEAALAAIVTLAMLYCLTPQVMAIPREPHLARSYVAPLTKREDKQPRWRDTYRKVLEPVMGREVVFSDPLTSWPAPSFRGRVMSAYHFEFFVPGQWQRYEDANRFFATRSEPERISLLKKYEARWLLVDSAQLDERQQAEIIRERSVRSRAGPLVLMDVQAWVN
ncbi:MAG TPA: hypothetical protein VJU16_03025 [Planctomycetota bacterium]|nr:hypothetical protein [Planctomycetota bacterium]